MIRALKAAAAVAVLGVLMGGQCTTSSSGTLSFAWRFSDAKGNLAGDFTAANNGCSTAFVDGITLTLDNTDYTGYPCAAPGNSPTGTPTLDITNVPAGTHNFTINAYRGAELVFQAFGQIDSSGPNTPVDVTLSPAGTASSLPVFYTQNGTYSCANTYYVEYAVLDASGTTTLDYANYGTGNALVCDPASPHFLPNYPTGGDAYPFGAYWLHYLTLTSSTGVVQFQTCCVHIDHEGFAQVVNALSPPQSCPATCP